MDMRYVTIWLKKLNKSPIDSVQKDAFFVLEVVTFKKSLEEIVEGAY